MSDPFNGRTPNDVRADGIWSTADFFRDKDRLAGEELRLECARIAALALSGYTSMLNGSALVPRIAKQIEEYVKTGVVPE